MADVTFKDNYVIMTSLVTSCHWIFIRRRANLIVLVTDEISLLNFQELTNGGFFSVIPIHKYWYIYHMIAKLATCKITRF